MQISWTHPTPATQFLLTLSAKGLQKDPTTFAITMKEEICVKLSYYEDIVNIDGYVFGEDAFVGIMDLVKMVHEIVKVPMSGTLILRGEVRFFTCV